MEKIERIRSQSIKIDWSAMIVSDATLDDLDPAAIAKARENYLAKYLDKATEAKEWDTVTFLNKAKLTIKGRITNTALLLLRARNPNTTSIRRTPKSGVLKDLKNKEKD
jgi:ATP-dependent DNA helicase RecG